MVQLETIGFLLTFLIFNVLVTFHSLAYLFTVIDFPHHITESLWNADEAGEKAQQY